MKEKVTAIIVVRNGEKYIKNSIYSIIDQDYPLELIEIIVIDGSSTDNTVGIVNEIIDNADFDIRLMHNPKKILSTGWNIGILNARYDYVFRIDAHSIIPPNYIKDLIEIIVNNNDIVCAGGRLRTICDNALISHLLSSPFGIGNSQFRYSNKSGFVDTVAYGIYKKSLFEKYGHFNEKFIRNQDLEFHSRLLKSEKIYLNASVEVQYYSRANLKDLLLQSYSNGKWNLILFKSIRSALSLRHLVPFIFVLSLLILPLLGFFNIMFILLLLFELALYFILAIYSSLVKTHRLFDVLKLVIVFFLFHITYGIGSLIGFFRSVK